MISVNPSPLPCIIRILLASMLIVTVGQVSRSDAASCGDTNASGQIDITDAVYLINYIFAGGPAPQDDGAGDFNCSSQTDIVDAVFMINYIFASGPAPCSGIDCGPNVITDQERRNALQAIDSVSSLLGAVSPDSLATALVAFLNSRDEFEAVGKQGKSVWARFDDGRMVMIPNNRFPGSSTGAPYPKGYAPPRTSCSNSSGTVAAATKQRKNIGKESQHREVAGSSILWCSSLGSICSL